MSKHRLRRRLYQHAVILSRSSRRRPRIALLHADFLKVVPGVFIEWRVPSRALWARPRCIRVRPRRRPRKRGRPRSEERRHRRSGDLLGLWDRWWRLLRRMSINYPVDTARFTRGRYSRSWLDFHSPWPFQVGISRETYSPKHEERKGAAVRLQRLSRANLLSADARGKTRQRSPSLALSNLRTRIPG